MSIIMNFTGAKRAAPVKIKSQVPHKFNNYYRLRGGIPLGGGGGGGGQGGLGPPNFLPIFSNTLTVRSACLVTCSKSVL